MVIITCVFSMVNKKPTKNMAVFLVGFDEN